MWGRTKWPSEARPDESAQKLDGRHLGFALANTDGDGATRVVLLMEILPLPLRGGHQAGHLVGQVYPGLLADAVRSGVPCNGVDPQPLRQGVEVGIAGLRNGFVDGEKAVMVVAFEEAAIKISAAIADDLHGFGDSLLQAGRGHDDFEGGTGR